MQAKHSLPLLLLFLLALAVRVIGLDFGYFLGDERINDAARALGGDLVPRQHFYPPLFNYLNAVAFGGLFVFGKLTGIWADGAAFRAQYFSDPTVFYITARAVTAATGALLAPIAYVIAKDLRMGRAGAIWVAVLVSLTPISVYFSYIAKSDMPLASATLWVVLIFLAQIRTPASLKLAFLLGAGVALCLSFKQSVVFFLAPLFVAHMVVLIPVMGASAYLKRVLASLGALIVLWPILNIGIILDFQNFLEFQKIQAVISVKEDVSRWQGLALLIERAANLQWGVGWILAPLYLAVPIWLGKLDKNMPEKRGLWALWSATTVGMILFAITAGDRQPEHFWLFFFCVVALLVALMLVDLMRRRWKLAFGAAWASFALSVVALVLLWMQTLSAPVRVAVSEDLRTQFSDRKIMSMIALDIPQTQAAQSFEFARNDRLAAKYEVGMPPIAAERYITEDVAGAQFVVDFPTTLYGLEDASDEDLKGKVKPYAWPLQKDEWQVDYWRAQGVDVLVVSDLEHHMTDARSVLLREFFTEVAETCQLQTSLAPVKPLFLERQIDIFDCARPD